MISNKDVQFAATQSKITFLHRQSHSSLLHIQWLFDGGLHRMTLAGYYVPQVPILQNNVVQMLMLRDHIWCVQLVLFYCGSLVSASLPLCSCQHTQTPRLMSTLQNTFCFDVLLTVWRPLLGFTGEMCAGRSLLTPVPLNLRAILLSARIELGPVSRESRKAISETANRLF